MNHEINIGKIYNMDIQMEVPKRTIVISEDQKNILLLFANKTIDKDGYPIYSINGCNFQITLHFNDQPYFKQKQEIKNQSI